MVTQIKPGSSSGAVCPYDEGKERLRDGDFSSSDEKVSHCCNIKHLATATVPLMMMIMNAVATTPWLIKFALNSLDWNRGYGLSSSSTAFFELPFFVDLFSFGSGWSLLFNYFYSWFSKTGSEWKQWTCQHFGSEVKKRNLDTFVRVLMPNFLTNSAGFA